MLSTLCALSEPTRSCPPSSQIEPIASGSDSSSFKLESVPSSTATRPAQRAGSPPPQVMRNCVGSAGGAFWAITLPTRHAQRTSAARASADAKDAGRPCPIIACSFQKKVGAGRSRGLPTGADYMLASGIFSAEKASGELYEQPSAATRSACTPIPAENRPSAQLAGGQVSAQFFENLGAQFRDVVCFPAIVWPDVELRNFCRDVGRGGFFLSEIFTQTPGRGANGTGTRARRDRGVSR